MQLLAWHSSLCRVCAGCDSHDTKLAPVPIFQLLQAHIDLFTGFCTTTSDFIKARVDSGGGALFADYVNVRVLPLVSGEKRKNIMGSMWP